MLGRPALSPSLFMVAFCSRCPVGLSGPVSLITCDRCSRNVPCVGYVGPPVVAESGLLLAHSWVGLTFRLADCED